MPFDHHLVAPNDDRMLNDEQSDDDARSEDYRTMPSSSKRVARRDPDEYKLSNALKVPRATTYTAQALYEQILSNDINLDPEYQRDVVWTQQKQTGLVDSVLRNFYIPPIIFAVNTFDDGTETKTCIDGKQRLTSIHRFMEGLIPRKNCPFVGLSPLTKYFYCFRPRPVRCDNLSRLSLTDYPAHSETGEKYWYKDNPGAPSKREKNLLPEYLCRLFANKQVVCVEYQDLTDDGERDIFQRVQLGMALTPSEKLQVINTPRAQLIRELMNAYPLENLPYDRSRATDFRCYAVIAHVLMNYPKGKNIALGATLTKWLDLTAEVSDSFRTKMIEALERAEEIKVPEQNGKGKVSPVEVIFIVILASIIKEKENLSALVKDMRADVREAFRDVRTNISVGKHMLEFVKQADKGRKGSRYLEDELEEERIPLPRRSRKLKTARDSEDFRQATGNIRGLQGESPPNPQNLPSPNTIT
ncbi:uncharacterized protein BT62DRAFT_1081595 [Guyanagaster necrorhizus]|uniref:GmrSD restriction endonucleases N-terminal domain-containing protein n=1 Tax=Guyanagaster necrorhizus TaxID=856835 RepID=A0A9P7VF52_9AGAR|nr:uncharacterized protein BT62DRAFT_1081595 [Guyanagaster necrorhizus MCA 3950]KAG7439442.1 hypothetical protein BT62DRAFT_1081595 [Guyanagaster necrorhizus MCA 3950]